MRDYPYTIAAGATTGPDVRGRFLRVKEASGPVRVRALAEHGGELANVTMTAGMRFELPAEFIKIRITNEGAGSVDAVVTVGNGSADDSSVTGSLNIDKAATLATVADVSIGATSTVLVAAADTTRREILITNLSTNTAAFRIGDSNTGAARGVELLPGSTVTLTTTAAVYAYNPTAGAESLGVVEVKD